MAVKSKSAILGWIVRHAARRLRVQYVHVELKPSGRAALEELNLVRLDSRVLTFGENVLARRSGVPDNRLTSAWSLGFWLGPAT